MDDEKLWAEISAEHQIKKFEKEISMRTQDLPTKKDKLFWWLMGIISFLFCTAIIGWVSGVESKLSSLDKINTQLAIIETKLDNIQSAVDTVSADLQKVKDQRKR